MFEFQLGVALMLVVGGALFLCLLLFVAGPLVIYFLIKQSARPEPIPFAPGQVRLPPEIEQYFSGVCWALDAEGFQVVTGIALPKQMAQFTTMLIFLVNRQERLSATVAAVVPDSNSIGSVPTQSYLEFVSRFRDGRIVQTNNSSALSPFPRRENTVNTPLPSVTDPRHLYGVHRALAILHGSGERVLRLDEDFGGDACRYLQSAMVEELEHAARTGYMRLDTVAGVYRPTIVGAFLMTWRELWPLKSIRLSRRRRSERRLLTELALQMPELAGIGS